MKLYYIKRKGDMFNDKLLCDKILDIIANIITGILFMSMGAGLVLLLFKKYGL